MGDVPSLLMLAFDTRIMLAAVIGVQILVQLLKTKKTEKVSQSVRPAWEDDKDVVATSKIARLQRRITKLQADNETLATEVVLLRSELADATTPTPSPPRPLASPSPKQASPAPSSCRRLPLELLEDGSFRLRVPSTDSAAAPAEEKQSPNGTTLRTPGITPSTSQGALDRLFDVKETTPSPAANTIGALQAEISFEDENKRLEAENEAVRLQLEAMAPGSARNSARASSGIVNAAEENERLQVENRELRDQLSRLMVENEDLGRRIMEVAFTSFSPEERPADVNSPTTPNWTLAECLESAAEDVKPARSPSRQLVFGDEEDNAKDEAGFERIAQTISEPGELVEKVAARDMTHIKTLNDMTYDEDESPTGVDAFADAAPSPFGTSTPKSSMSVGVVTKLEALTVTGASENSTKDELNGNGDILAAENVPTRVVFG